MVENLPHNYFVRKLLKWFKTNKRNFSWRMQKDPYKILVAEKMLQKTSAKNVQMVYKKFIEKYPTPAKMANAKLSAIEKSIKPLGLQKKRAKEFKKLARKIVKEFGGKIPSDNKKLSSFLGIGNYISNAVLCFGFGADVSLVDTNVSRIMERVFGLKAKKDARRDKNLLKFANNLVPRGRAKQFNWALLDLGAKICTARKPKCKICPVNNICMYYSRR